MSCHHRLNKAFKNVPVLPLNSESRYVLISDCHRGNGTHNDNFLKNQHLYFAALQYYYRNDFHYIELGDGDELWENRSMAQIKEVHNNVFWQLSLFYVQNRLHIIYGNHDIVKKHTSFQQKKCASYFCSSSQQFEPLFPGITFYSGLVLRDDSAGKSLYLTHGHQSSFLASTLWPIDRFLVRYVWKPFEQIGVLDPTSAAKNYKNLEKAETRLLSWANYYNRTLITGHTHRPMMLTPERPYANTGSCVHPRCITCIEVVNHELILVKWFVDINIYGNLTVSREELASERY